MLTITKHSSKLFDKSCWVDSLLSTVNFNGEMEKKIFFGQTTQSCNQPIRFFTVQTASILK